MFVAACALAQEPEPQVDEAPAYTARGADVCLGCHDESTEFPVLSIFQTRHAQTGDPGSPFAQRQCETCHGPGAAHAQRVRRGDAQASIRSFGSGTDTPVAEQNAVCLGCHERDAGDEWHGSAHAFADLSCTSCHTIHAAADPVLSRDSQPTVCFDCHPRQRTESLMASTHPIRYGQIDCAACHLPHGGPGPAALARISVNDTCFACHAEKRGPLLWEHAPVSEDCTLCHQVHGSMHPALLTARPPLLCQRCHSQAGHPSIANSSAGLPPLGASPMLLGGSCLNCHSQIHGSNHPSGAGLMR
jgi:DmsE family decaheme c-type cytochrome